MSNELKIKSALFVSLIGLVFGLSACGLKSPNGHGEAVGQGAEQSAGAGEENSLKVSQASRALIGLTVAEVVYRPMAEEIPLTGEIARDTENIHQVLPPVSGEVIELNVHAGDTVKTGQLVAMVAAGGNSRVSIYSSANGVVVGEHLTVGSRVDAMTSLLTIADLSSMWANFDVHEKDVAKVRKGQAIEISSSAYPDTVFHGRVVFVSPEVDDTLRTIKIRVQVANPGNLLKFNMFVTGSILVPQGKPVLTIPLEAVQDIKDEHMVFVPGEGDAISARTIKTGLTSGKNVQVLAGLTLGEKVVANGSFALKSEFLKSTFGED